MVQMVVTSVVQYVLRSLGQDGYDFISNPCRDVTNVLLSLDRPMVYTDNEVYRIVFFEIELLDVRNAILFGRRRYVQWTKQRKGYGRLGKRNSFPCHC